jgi:hypothetical protein
LREQVPIIKPEENTNTTQIYKSKTGNRQNKTMTAVIKHQYE